MMDLEIIFFGVHFFGWWWWILGVRFQGRTLYLLRTSRGYIIGSRRFWKPVWAFRTTERGNFRPFCGWWWGFALRFFWHGQTLKHGICFFENFWVFQLGNWIWKGSMFYYNVSLLVCTNNFVFSILNSLKGNEWRKDTGQNLYAFKKEEWIRILIYIILNRYIYPVILG